RHMQSTNPFMPQHTECWSSPSKSFRKELKTSSQPSNSIQIALQSRWSLTINGDESLMRVSCGPINRWDICLEGPVCWNVNGIYLLVFAEMERKGDRRRE